MTKPALGESEAVGGVANGNDVWGAAALDCELRDLGTQRPTSAAKFERSSLSDSAIIDGAPGRSSGSDTTRIRNSARTKGGKPDRPVHPGAQIKTLQGILGRSEFLQVLRREKRRTDRTKTPLSMMIFRLEDLPSQHLGALQRFIKYLYSNKRETDYLGQLDENVFAVLFPDTDEVATRYYAQRILDRNEGQAISTITASYPKDQLEEIAAVSNATSEFEASGWRPFECRTAPVTFSEEYFLKRPIDVLGAALALLLLSPVMLITAAAIAATSRGPVIYKQARLGRGGVPFVFYKFRSMATDSGDDIHRRYVQDLIKGQIEGRPQSSAASANYKLADDPRITPVGRWIRKWSIDELPQLVNVLRGEMSLVGPRPPIPYEADDYQSWHRRRVLEMKPGITGLWQVEGRSRVSFDEMVRMDLRYIQNCSLGLDLMIMLRTVGAVLRAEGAG